MKLEAQPRKLFQGSFAGWVRAAFAALFFPYFWLARRRFPRIVLGGLAIDSRCLRKMFWFGILVVSLCITIWEPLYKVLVARSFDLTAVAAGAQHPQGAASGPMSGKRVIFDETFQFWTTRGAADHTLNRIKEAGFTVYVPVVWYGAGTTWPSRHAPWDPTVAKQAAAGFDPLGYVIAKAHSLGIEVHPWFTVALRRSDIFPDLALQGVFERGELGIFDIHNPRFRALITDLIVEVVRNYDVDGINLDYIRAMGLCLNIACRNEYRGRYHRDLETDAALFRVAPRLVPSLIEYQESTVTGLVRQISGEVRAVKPTVPISADAFPELTDYLNGQNSIEWVNRGDVDVLFRMDYAQNIDYASTDSVRARLKSPDRLTVIAGNYDLVSNGAVPRSGRWLVQTMREMTARWPRSGVALYLYNQLSDEQVEALKRDNRRIQSGGLGSPIRLEGD